MARNACFVLHLLLQLQLNSCSCGCSRRRQNELLYLQISMHNLMFDRFLVNWKNLHFKHDCIKIPSLSVHERPSKCYLACNYLPVPFALTDNALEVFFVWRLEVISKLWKYCQKMWFFKIGCTSMPFSS